MKLFVIDKEWLEHIKYAEDVNSLSPQDIIGVIIDSLEPLDSEPIAHNHSEPRIMPDCPLCCYSEKKEYCDHVWVVYDEQSGEGYSHVKMLCDLCGKTKCGLDVVDKEERCTKCNGTKQIFHISSYKVTCPHCNGSGKEPRKEVAIEYITQYSQEYKDLESKLAIATEALKKIEGAVVIGDQTLRMVAREALEKIKGKKVHYCITENCSCGNTVAGLKLKEVVLDEFTPAQNGERICSICNHAESAHEGVMRGFCQCGECTGFRFFYPEERCNKCGHKVSHNSPFDLCPCECNKNKERY